LFTDYLKSGNIGGNKIGKRVQLLSIRRPDLTVSISAFIHSETKSLVIAGHDCGEFVQNFKGDSDYEYWVIIPAHEKLKFLADLQGKGFGRKDWQIWVSDDVRLLSAVKARFGGNNELITDIQKYCADIGIGTEFHSY